MCLCLKLDSGKLKRPDLQSLPIPIVYIHLLGLIPPINNGLLDPELGIHMQFQLSETGMNQYQYPH